MTLLSGFADISLAQLVLVAVVALIAAVVGGVSGYGNGALMPLVLVPMIGAAPVVPIIAIAALFNNFGRVSAFFKYLDRRRAAIGIAASLPTCVLGAWGYTYLTGAGAALVIGSMLIASVPLRRLLRHHDIRIGDRGFALGTVGYGVVVGGTAGSSSATFGTVPNTGATLPSVTNAAHGTTSTMGTTAPGSGASTAAGTTGGVVSPGTEPIGPQPLTREREAVAGAASATATGGTSAATPDITPASRATGTLGANGSSLAPATVPVTSPPPAATPEIVPPSPGTNLTWVPGHYTWTQNSWRWIPGAWATAPQAGSTWIDGRYDAATGRWTEGHWQAGNGTLTTP